MRSRRRLLSAHLPVRSVKYGSLVIINHKEGLELYSPYKVLHAPQQAEYTSFSHAVYMTAILLVVLQTILQIMILLAKQEFMHAITVYHATQ